MKNQTINPLKLIVHAVFLMRQMGIIIHNQLKNLIQNGLDQCQSLQTATILGEFYPVIHEDLINRIRLHYLPFLRTFARLKPIL